MPGGLSYDKGLNAPIGGYHMPRPISPASYTTYAVSGCLESASSVTNEDYQLIPSSTPPDTVKANAESLRVRPAELMVFYTLLEVKAQTSEFRCIDGLPYVLTLGKHGEKNHGRTILDFSLDPIPIRRHPTSCLRTNSCIIFNKIGIL